jgi:hypothetical protein
VNYRQNYTDSGVNTMGINTQTLITLRALSRNTSEKDELYEHTPMPHLRHAQRVTALRQQSPATSKT